MRFVCSKCSREYESAEPSLENEFLCDCGKIIDLEEIRTLAQLVEGIEDERQVAEIQKRADEISRWILDSSFPEIDIELAKDRLREKCLEYFPEKEYLYEMLYESRFRRLWEQFRADPSEEES